VGVGLLENGFQFLIGRLDTPAVTTRWTVEELFQFLIGRLDTGYSPSDGTSDSGFNSS